jgi:hypothetical protein
MWVAMLMSDVWYDTLQMKIKWSPNILLHRIQRLLHKNTKPRNIEYAEPNINSKFLELLPSLALMQSKQEEHIAKYCDILLKWK